MHDGYKSPLGARYASVEMSAIFSDHYKFTHWRRLWTALAKGQMALGLGITQSQIDALGKELETIDYGKVHSYEKEFRHDVMAHIHAFGDAAPSARSIIHLGATSSYVTDNTDLAQMRAGLELLRLKLVQIIRNFSRFCDTYAALPTLGLTHYQPAQPTTVGKRGCLWLQDFISDLLDCEARLADFAFLGVKGATGTQASFCSLFSDLSSVEKLESLVAREMGWERIFPITAQTYPRKQDMRIISVLTGVAMSAHKFATDLRLLAGQKEMEEPFAKKQVGSSAMPYKRNPMRSERICSLAHFLFSLGENPAYTAANQWLERTLDDSANRRLVLPEAFLTADAICNLLIDVTDGLIVYPKMIQRHLQEELPFLATENILMEAVKKGGDRQLLHERLREHSVAASRLIKEEGLACDLLVRIEKDSAFGLSPEEIALIVNPKHFIGRSDLQVKSFLKNEVGPLLEKRAHLQAPRSAIEL